MLVLGNEIKKGSEGSGFWTGSSCMMLSIRNTAALVIL